jgi:hypothetical protein
VHPASTGAENGTLSFDVTSGRHVVTMSDSLAAIALVFTFAHLMYSLLDILRRNGELRRFRGGKLLRLPD